MLQEVITAAESHKGTLQLWQDNSKRKGLHETLLLRCMNCHKEFPFETGNRLGGKGGGGTDVGCVMADGRAARALKSCMALKQPDRAVSLFI